MSKASFNWEDPLLLDTQLTEEERMVRDAAAQYAQDKLMPRILDAYRNETTDPSIFREMGELGLLGITIPEQYGGMGLGKVSMCVVSEELSRAYIGVGSLGTRSEIAAELILCGGTDEQKVAVLTTIAQKQEQIMLAAGQDAAKNPKLAEFITEAKRHGTAQEIVDTQEKLGFDTGVSESPITPVIVGDAALAVAARNAKIILKKQMLKSPLPSLAPPPARRVRHFPDPSA